MEVLLERQSDELDVPSRAFVALPRQCFYMPLNELTLDEVRYQGAFVHLNCEEQGRNLQLRFFLLKHPGDGIGFGFRINHRSVESNLQECLQQIADLRFVSQEESENSFQQFARLVTKLVKVALFTCCTNADIRPMNVPSTLS